MKTKLITQILRFPIVVGLANSCRCYFNTERMRIYTKRIYTLKFYQTIHKITIK